MFLFIMYSKQKLFDIMRCKIFGHKRTETLNLDIMTREELSFQRLINELK